VAHDHGADGVRVDLLLAQRRQAGGPTVQQHRGRRSLVEREGDAGLKPTARAERITAAHHRHSHQPILALHERPVEVQSLHRRLDAESDASRGRHQLGYVHCQGPDGVLLPVRTVWRLVVDIVIVHHASGLVADGSTHDVTVADVYAVKDSHVVRMQAYADSAEALAIGS